MKFLVDENESANVCGPLAQLHPGHVFRHVTDEGLNGLQDVDLFAAMAERDFGALITLDGAQITAAATAPTCWSPSRLPTASSRICSP